MTYKLFIDDEREPPTFALPHSWVVARSSQEAIQIIEERGLPDYISFDHDLGGNDTAMNVLHYFEEQCCKPKGLLFPSYFSYYVHSQNPIGKQNIICMMENLLKYFSK